MKYIWRQLLAQPTKTMAVLDVLMPYSLSYRQPGDLRVIRGVADGVWKEARTRGVASLGFPKFNFIGFIYSAPVKIRSLLQASNLT